jgi:hypothetical protein
MAHLGTFLAMFIFMLSAFITAFLANFGAGTAYFFGSAAAQAH